MDSYSQIIKYLYSLEFSGIKLGLENVRRLLDRMGNPQNRFPAFHIAGTNGKGSTAAFIYAICRQAGYRTGIYTSPHLIDFSERICVDDENIDWNTIVDYTRDIREHIEKYTATFFEATTALAFRYFADRKVDIAVVETGLGGRLDATNLVHPVVSVITSVSFDHMQYLGETITQIAEEKAGIIKSGIPCVTNNTDPEILKVLEKKCAEIKAPFYELNPAESIQIREQSLEGSIFDLTLSNISLDNIRISLAGRHQVVNAALAALAVIKAEKMRFREESIRAGLGKARWQARLQVVDQKPLTILDVAHNPEGFEKVFTFLEENLPERTIWIILGLSKDKDYRKIADILTNRCQRIGVVEKFSDRGMEAAVLTELLRSKNLLTDTFPGIEEACNYYRKAIPKESILLIIGSHYLAGEFLKKIQLS
ncbi:MAG: bifunctional folylpolyglutamate synthase/dihydrofolate synthase [Calditrichaeota bacterium]|nr:bifunctional folylpolyglutamate synthase/dihydrofolate synthase [Calditrichota bacterium]RQV92604.1 MAG: bifunctional folylpolyglutamate synthase/dihydrofolate synthase [bacterium]RQV99773.1 MAG: bifunctional folylpolyglutamate synthase/dihydrofolate synthase [Calditrichota bacterium]